MGLLMQLIAIAAGGVLARVLFSRDEILFLTLLVLTAAIVRAVV